MRALTPIKDIAESVCVDDLGDSTLKYFTFVLGKMADGFREMHLFMSDTFSVKTEVIPVDSLTVSMPDDFIEPTKVGVKVNGHLYVLWRDYGSLNAGQHPGPAPFQETPLTILDMETPPDNMIPFYNCGGTNVMWGSTVGINPSGWYTFNRNDGTIKIGSNWPVGADIVVEYKSDGVSNGLTLVPTEWITALKEYALWKYWMRKRDLQRSQLHKQEYLTQYYMIKDMYVNQPINYMARIFQNTPRQTINNLM